MSRRTKPSRVFLLSLLSTLVLSPQASYALSEPETAALMDVRAESDYQQLRSKWRSGFLGGCWLRSSHSLKECVIAH